MVRRFDKGWKKGRLHQKRLRRVAASHHSVSLVPIPLVASSKSWCYAYTAASAGEGSLGRLCHQSFWSMTRSHHFSSCAGPYLKGRPEEEVLIIIDDVATRTVSGSERAFANGRTGDGVVCYLFRVFDVMLCMR